MSDLSAGQGITVAIGFKIGTFAAYQMSTAEQIFAVWTAIQIATAILLIIGAVVFVSWWKRKTNRTAEIGTIVAEFLPPKDYSVTIAAKVSGYSQSVMTAQLIDLAVRHFIRIIETSPKKGFKSAEYSIKIERSIENLHPEERYTIEDMFGRAVVVGDELNLKSLKNNSAYAERSDMSSEIYNLIRQIYKLRESNEILSRKIKKIGIWSLAIGLLSLSIPIVIFAVVIFIIGAVSYRLTDKGLDLVRYMKGLKLYIGVAEIDRLKMLQSPEGAERIGQSVNGEDSAQIIKLYEKVLPYAIIFGQEKQWSKELGKYYENASAEPDWYSGQGAFNAVLFMSAMNGFSSINNSYMASSSSTGGSGGGGFSGGGGGGGGCGGW